MSDARLRELERAAATGDVDALARLWSERLRRGLIDPAAGPLGVYCRDLGVIKALGYRPLANKSVPPPTPTWNSRTRGPGHTLVYRYCTCPLSSNRRRVHHENCQHASTPGPDPHTMLESPPPPDGNPITNSAWIGGLSAEGMPREVVLRALLDVVDRLTTILLCRNPYFAYHRTGCTRLSDGSMTCECAGLTGRENEPLAIRQVFSAAREHLGCPDTDRCQNRQRGRSLSNAMRNLSKFRQTLEQEGWSFGGMSGVVARRDEARRRARENPPRLRDAVRRTADMLPNPQVRNFYPARTPQDWGPLELYYWDALVNVSRLCMSGDESQFNQAAARLGGCLAPREPLAAPALVEPWKGFKPLHDMLLPFLLDFVWGRRPWPTKWHHHSMDSAPWADLEDAMVGGGIPQGRHLRFYGAPAPPDPDGPDGDRTWDVTRFPRTGGPLAVTLNSGSRPYGDMGPPDAAAGTGSVQPDGVGPDGFVDYKTAQGQDFSKPPGEDLPF